MARLNERLRASFEEFRLDKVPDEDAIAVIPILRATAIVDAAALYADWREAGEPEPTPEEIEEYEALSRAPEMVGADGAVPTGDLPAASSVLLWATGRDVIRPPAKALTVALSEKGRNRQEYRPIPSGLALPPLVIAA